MKKNIKKIVKKNMILLFAVAIYLVVFFLKRDLFDKSLLMTFIFLKEMALILPPILIISALIMVWIPKEFIVKVLGHESGIKGKLLSLFVGSFSAGPIYAAFPITHTLLLKGASISNIVVILTSWAVIKVPMLLVEAKFLGFRFTLTRYLLTLPFIFTLGFIMQKLVKKENIPDINTNEDVKE